MNDSLQKDFKDKSLDEKLDLIEEIAASNDIDENGLIILECLSKDEDDEVRSKVAEVLVISNSSEAEKILVKLLKDKDELVRVNACDSLCNSNSKEVIKLLMDRAKRDKSTLVRGYAALSIADIVIRINSNRDELVRFFENCIAIEKVTWVKINFYKVLYYLGQKARIKDLLKELDDRLYRNRSATVNILAELISKENEEEIKAALQKRLSIEKTVAVRSSIESVLNNNT